MEPFSSSFGIRYRPVDQPTARERYAHGGGGLGRFVETAGLTVIAGRNFADGDRDGAPATALVSEALAQRTWPGDAALGKRLLVRRYDGNPIEVAVIGVTRNVQERVDNAERDAIFLPSPLAFEARCSLWVQTTGDPERLVAHPRQIVRDLDPRLPILQSGPAEAWRYRRLGLVSGEAMRLTLAGLAVGLLLALPSAAIARALLVELSPFRPRRVHCPGRAAGDCRPGREGVARETGGARQPDDGAAQNIAQRSRGTSPGGDTQSGHSVLSVPGGPDTLHLRSL